MSRRIYRISDLGGVIGLYHADNEEDARAQMRAQCGSNTNGRITIEDLGASYERLPGFGPLDDDDVEPKTPKPPKMRWSSHQEAVFDDVEHGKGHTVVLARAGGGKTTVILESLKRVPYTLSVLCVAFNKAIAGELKSRLGDCHAEVSTLHAFGLRTCAKGLGRVEIDKSRAWKLISHLHGTDKPTWTRRRALEKTLSLAKACLAETAEQIEALIDSFEIDVPDGDHAKFALHVLELLDESQQFNGTIDFDDMIWLPHVLDLRPKRYDRVFIDETQDLNAAQLSLALKAVKKSGRIVAVGDDRQAIYGFRGAAEGAVDRVVSTLNAKTLPLSITYRCARSIVAVANSIVPDLTAAPDAPKGSVSDSSLPTLLKEAQPGDFILSRSNAPLVSLCMKFLRARRRAQIQGRDMGAQLKAWVRSTRAADVEGLRAAIDKWEAAELKRLAEKGRDTANITDRARTLHVLSDGATCVSDVEATIDQLFSDSDDSNTITLSSTHRAKGLERDRVWVLQDTYRRRPGVEEDNLWYVAVTRAKSDLRLVNFYPPKAG